MTTVKVVFSPEPEESLKKIEKVEKIEKAVQPSLIKKPLLAETLEDVAKLTFPCLATPKIDGIRALRLGGSMVSRQFKPIRNQTMRSILSALLPEGSDGEIMTGETFQDVSSKVMSVSGGINFTDPFIYYWFDYVKDDPNKSYEKRIEDMKRYVEDHPEILAHQQAKIIPLYPTVIGNAESLLAYEGKALEDKFEGVMVRSPGGKYKMGRSTLREGILLKLKRFADAEATVVAVQELFHNENEKEKNELGGSKRSSKKEGLVPAGKLGSLEVVNDAGEKFNIGTGFTDQMRKEFWNEAQSLIGKTVKYKYFQTGSKNAPRFPTFLGFRDEADM